MRFIIRIWKKIIDDEWNKSFEIRNELFLDKSSPNLLGFYKTGHSHPISAHLHCQKASIRIKSLLCHRILLTPVRIFFEYFDI